MRRKTLLALVAGLIFAIQADSAARPYLALAAAIPEARRQTQQQIRDYLAAYPYGQGAQTGPAEITFLPGQSEEFVITFERPAHEYPGPDCPLGWLCLYDGINFAYPRARFDTCGGADLRWWGWNNRVESVHHNVTPDAIRPDDPRLTPEGRVALASFIDSSAYESSQRVKDIRRLFQMDTHRQLAADLGPHRNVVDFVYLFCA